MTNTQSSKDILPPELDGQLELVRDFAPSLDPAVVRGRMAQVDIPLELAAPLAEIIIAAKFGFRDRGGVYRRFQIPPGAVINAYQISGAKVSRIKSWVETFVAELSQDAQFGDFGDQEVKSLAYLVLEGTAENYARAVTDGDGWSDPTFF